jgi:hypothetical protein
VVSSLLAGWGVAVEVVVGGRRFFVGFECDHDGEAAALGFAEQMELAFVLLSAAELFEVRVGAGGILDFRFWIFDWNVWWRLGLGGFGSSWVSTVSIVSAVGVGVQSPRSNV